MAEDLRTVDDATPEAVANRAARRAPRRAKSLWSSLRRRTRASRRRDWKDDAERAIGSISDLSDEHKEMIKGRWLEQMVWMDRRADQSRKWHIALRTIAITGGLVVSMLVSFKVYRHQLGPESIIFIGFVISAAGAAEQIFHFGEKWRHYRQVVEALKGEGWRFLELAGRPYQGKSHEDNFTLFAARVEKKLSDEVDVYMKLIGREEPTPELPEPTETSEGHAKSGGSGG